MSLHHVQSDEIMVQPAFPPGGDCRTGNSTTGVLAALVFSALMLAVAVAFFLLTNERTNSRPGSGSAEPANRPVIEGDLEARNQEGETVRLSDLRGKVWAVAEFFAVCPTCSRRNSTDLRSLAKRFAEESDFHLVCISIDPDADDVKVLAEYSSAFGARSDKWWFLTGDPDELRRFLEDELLFPPVRERTNEAAIASLGRYLHDLGITVVDRQMRIVGSRDLAWAANQSSALKDEWERDLYRLIETELRSPAL